MSRLMCFRKIIAVMTMAVAAICGGGKEAVAREGVSFIHGAQKAHAIREIGSRHEFHIDVGPVTVSSDGLHRESMTGTGAFFYREAFAVASGHKTTPLRFTDLSGLRRSYALYQGPLTRAPPFCGG